MMMVALSLALGVLLGSAQAQRTRAGNAHGTVERQVFSWFRGGVEIDGAKFRDVSEVPAVGRGAASATVSAEIEGGPVVLRVLSRNGRILRPGQIRFTPAGGEAPSLTPSSDHPRATGERAAIPIESRRRLLPRTRWQRSGGCRLASSITSTITMTTGASAASEA